MSDLPISYAFNEANAVMRLLELSENGYLDRVRTCVHCQCWFYAIRADGKFCRFQCRQQYFRSSPAFKQKRKLYMRGWRKDEEEKHRKALARLKAARRG